MNVLIHERLSLREELPYHLRNYEVKDGRAWFSFPGEFDFAISIADEDTSRQMYFVDLRFLFKPQSELGEGPARNHVDYNANKALASLKRIAQEAIAWPAMSVQ